MRRLKKTVKSSYLNSKQKIIIVVSVVLTLLILAGILRTVSFVRTISIGKPETSSIEESKKEVTEYNFLLLGYGGGKHEGTYLTDTIILAHLNTKDKKLLLISFPRDMWVKVPVTNGEDFYSKINSLYQMGTYPKSYPNIDKSLLTTENPSGLLKKVIQDVSGLKVDSFASVDFQGFVKIINTLGGVEVNVEKSFTDYEYPIEENMNDLCGKDEDFAKIEPIINNQISQEEKNALFDANPEIEEFYTTVKERPVIAFPCRYETLTFTKGVTMMDGETALKFARSRHALGDGGDFNRARRQQLVINAVMEKVVSIGFIPKIMPLLRDLEQNIKTDLPLSEINKLLTLGSSFSEYKISSLVISDKYLKDDYSSYGGYILVSKDGVDNWQTLQNDIDNIIKGITPTVTPKNTNIPVKPNN